MDQLHVHDDMSIKDGCSSVETYAKKVVELGGDSLCITNHGQAGGMARQYFACRQAKIKPIFGQEIYLNEGRLQLERFKTALEVARKNVKKQIPGAKEKVSQIETYVREKLRPSRHAILIAKNRTGYKNLVRVSSDAWLNGFYYAPRTDTKFLAEHAEGLVYSTACIGGYIPTLARNDFSAGVTEAKRLMQIFGPDNFRVELMATAYEKQRETNEVMLKLAHEIGAKTIVTCDVHYAKPQDQQAQSVLLLMRDDKTIKDAQAGEGAWQFDSKDLYWKTLEDVIRVWQEHHKDYWPKEDFQKAIQNTYELAASVEDFEFDLGLKLPEVFDSPAATLRELVRKGLADRKSRGQIPVAGKSIREYAERAQRELSVIDGKNFAEYFLVLWDLCKFARESGARSGPGRGSAGGSLVAFLLGITEIDPLRFSLIFERFLDPSRKDAPDVDLDFSPGHRDGIKRYLEKKYPAVATIATYSTFKARSTIQAVARVYGLDHKEIQEITKPLGGKADGKKVDELSLDEVLEHWPEVKKLAEKNPEAWEVVKTLDGLVSHRGQHASGVLIGPMSALDELPLIRDPKTGTICTAFADTAVQGKGSDYEGREISRLGYVKVDILGLQNLDTMARVVEIIGRSGVTINFDTLPLDDPAPLALANAADVPGVFQLDTNTSRPLLRTVGVSAFDDLAAVTALARPGPLENKLHYRFAQLKRAGEDWKKEIPESLHADLAPTRGLMIFQEDIMKTLQVMGGMTVSESNEVRKIIGKKLDPALLKKWEARFVDGGVALGHDRETLAATYATLGSYAKYAFNRSHSVAYMLTAYSQLYLLAHYPIPYFAALLATTDRGKKAGKDGEDFVRHMRSALARGIPVYGPSVLSSGFEFDVEGEGIRFGLSKIKGVSNAASAIVEARAKFQEQAPGVRMFLEDLLDIVDRRKANAKTFQLLIRSGAFDDLDFQPEGVEDLIEEAREEPLVRRNALLVRHAFLTRKSKKKEFERPSLDVPSVLAADERELLGLFLSFWSGPEPKAIRESAGLRTIADEIKRDAPRLHLLVEVARLHVHKTGRGTMAFLALADETGTIENVVLFSTQWAQWKDKLGAGKIAAIRLARKESRDDKYGKWSYSIDDRSSVAPVESLLSLRRRALGASQAST